MKDHMGLLCTISHHNICPLTWQQSFLTWNKWKSLLYNAKYAAYRLVCIILLLALYINSGLYLLYGMDSFLMDFHLFHMRESISATPLRMHFASICVYRLRDEKLISKHQPHRNQGEHSWFYLGCIFIHTRGEAQGMKMSVEPPFGCKLISETIIGVITMKFCTDSQCAGMVVNLLLY